MSDKRKLPVIGATCFSAHQENKVSCDRKSCQNWFPQSSFQNCSIIGAQISPWTLQEIGKVYGLTRMRICQIEKKIIKMIKESC